MRGSTLELALKSTISLSSGNSTTDGLSIRRERGLFPMK